jgi:hypothetical protein
MDYILHKLPLAAGIQIADISLARAGVELESIDSAPDAYLDALLKDG